MIKKYYIPTSTLNFNNILSSESISPKAFYEKRNFGYSRWTVIPENNLENAITLYDSLCYFERPQSDLEDHALLVEVELEENDVKPLGEGVFYCDKTIYLTPSSTRFIFFSERVKKIALSISNGSLETKMIRLYFNSICFVNQPTKSYLVKATDNVQIELNDEEIKKDFQTNKMKGLLYGYYIGSALSTTKENVKRLSCLFEIQNIFSAIRSSIDGKPKDFQAKQLDDLFDEICFSESEKKELDKILNEVSLSNIKKLDRLNTFFSTRKRWEDKKNNCLLQLQNLSENEEDVNPAIEWIEKEIKEQKGKIWREKVVLKTDSDEILVIDSLLNTIKNKYLKDDEITSLFKDWTNDILASEKYNGKISVFRGDIATDVTTKAKEVIGEEKWPEHQAKKYLNMLRHHIAGESLNYTWEDGVLSSLFSVILAGEEWDKMLKFMQRKEMTDYRLAFAMYGTLNGFANLTRDFTDILLNLDEVYVKDVYKEFYGQLFSRDCGKIDLTELENNGSIQKIQSEQNSSTKDVEVGNNIKEIEQGTPKKNNEETIEAPINHQPIKKNCGEGTTQPSELQCLKDIFNSSEFQNLPLEAQDGYKKESLWKGKNDKTFKNGMKELSEKCPILKTKGTWKDCIKLLNKQFSTNDPVLFSNNCEEIAPKLDAETNNGEHFTNVKSDIKNDELLKETNEEIKQSSPLSYSDEGVFNHLPKDESIQMQSGKKNFIIKESELDPQQMIVLQSNKSRLIVGPTQSGKTTILLHKALRAQIEGRSFFYIVLSRIFRDYLGHICKELGIPDSRVVTYSEWKHKLNKPQSDIVFVDDIDTFSYMDGSEDYINDLRESSSLLFFTSTKDIQIKDIESFRFNNHTKTNNSLNQICDNPIIQINNNWKKPHILCVSTKEKQIDKSFEIIKNSNCNNVGILVPTNNDIKIISTYAKEKKIIIETSDTLNPFSNIPKLLTYHAARGIHFDEVIMPLLKEETQDLELICRTMKGCRYQLFLICSVKKIPSWISNIPKELYSDGDSFDVL